MNHELTKFAKEIRISKNPVTNIITLSHDDYHPTYQIICLNVMDTDCVLDADIYEYWLKCIDEEVDFNAFKTGIFYTIIPSDDNCILHHPDFNTTYHIPMNGMKWTEFEVTERQMYHFFGIRDMGTDKAEKDCSCCETRQMLDEYTKESGWRM